MESIIQDLNSNSRYLICICSALNILNIEVSEDMPVLESSELSIACMVAGSELMEVCGGRLHDGKISFFI